MELLDPFLGHLDAILLCILGLSAETKPLRMLEEGVHIARVRGIQDVEKVYTVGQVSLGLLLREKLGEVGLLHHLGDQVDHAELVVFRYLYRTNLGHRDEMLLAGEDKLDKVLRQLLLRGKVVLS